MGKDKSAILRLIDSLEEKELVRRVVDPKDRRKNYIMVTKTGDRLIEQYMKIVYEILEDLKEGLTKSELETFHKVINHIKNKAGQI
jgi:DNA-binding MarR family transcriptional regulator